MMKYKDAEKQIEEYVNKNGNLSVFKGYTLDTLLESLPDSVFDTLYGYMYDNLVSAVYHGTIKLR